MNSISVLRHIDDFPGYSSMPTVVQEDVMAKLRWIHEILAAQRGGKKLVVQQAAADLQASAGAIHRYLRRFRDTGWRGLIDERHAGVGAKGLPPLFKSYVAGLYDSHQRDHDDAAEVHRKVLDRWNSWRGGNVAMAIPGYPTCPPPTPRTGAPHGWSYDRFLTLRPRDAERAAAKHGRKSAAAFLPAILTTRFGSRVLSRRLFDDQDLDNMIADGFLAIAGIDTISRPVSFNCLDFYTGRHVDHHLRMMYKDAATSTHKSLTGMEAVWFVIKQLQDHGWRTDEGGSELIFEHGTMNAWANQQLTSLGGHHSFEDALYALTDHKCYVNRSGKFEGPVFAGMCFRAQSTGNYKFKTWIESSFRLLRTYMQSFPGPIGSHARLNKKEELYGIRLAENSLLSAISQCPDREIQEFLVENIRHELLDLATFSQLIHSVYRAINLTTTHQLEGWARCGFTAPMWRTNEHSTHWFAQSELLEMFPDPEERSMILRKINSRRDLLTRIEPMSREAAWQLEMQRDSTLLKKLPDSMVGLLLPREWAKPVTIASNHTFTLADPLWPDTRQQYVASWDQRGSMVTLDGGFQALVYHNSFSDGRAQIHSMDGSYITTLYPTVRAETFNKTNTLAQLQQRSKMSSAQDAHLRARMDGIATDRQTAQVHNRSLLDLTREDRRRTKDSRAAATATAVELQTASHGTAADRALAQIQPLAETCLRDNLDF